MGACLFMHLPCHRANTGQKGRPDHISSESQCCHMGGMSLLAHPQYTSNATWWVQACQLACWLCPPEATWCGGTGMTIYSPAICQCHHACSSPTVRWRCHMVALPHLFSYVPSPLSHHVSAKACLFAHLPHCSTGTWQHGPAYSHTSRVPSSQCGSVGRAVTRPVISKHHSMQPGCCSMSTFPPRESRAPLPEAGKLS